MGRFPLSEGPIEAGGGTESLVVSYILLVVPVEGVKKSSLGNGKG